MSGFQQMVNNKFRMYDFDSSGTINSTDELSQLTINVTLHLPKLVKRFCKDNDLPIVRFTNNLGSVEAVLAGIEPLDDENAWGIE